MARKATPQVTLTYDVPAGGYQPGATAILTATRPAAQLSSTFTAPGLPPVTATAAVVLPGVLVANDGHTYALVSDDGSVAKYQTTV